MHGEKKRTVHVPSVQTNSRNTNNCVVLKDHQRKEQMTFFRLKIKMKECVGAAIELIQPSRI